MKHLITSVFLTAAMATPLLADGHTPPAPDNAMVYFIGLSDGDTVASPVTVRFGLSGMGIAPAGQDMEGTGHHHLLINRPPLGEGEWGEEEWDYGLPADDNHLHFGKGQTEVTLDLDPGVYTLQMALGSGSHVPYGPGLVTEVITITVE
jgi:hypothetical protein